MRTGLIMSSAMLNWSLLAETWRPFRTWVTVMMRALGSDSTAE